MRKYTVRSRAPALVSGTGEVESEAEALRWLVETALRCHALDVIAASACTRAAFVSIVRCSSFPHADDGVSSTSAPDGVNSKGLVEACAVNAGYVVMGHAPKAPQQIVERRAGDLLPLAVVKLVEAGDVVGAGKLVMRATQTHPALAASSAAAVVALEAYLLRVQRVSASGSQAGAAEGALVSVYTNTHTYT